MDVFIGEGLQLMDISEIEGDGFKLIENILLDGCFKIDRNRFFVCLDDRVDKFLCLLF
jgi:hypothetical protein